MKTFRIYQHPTLGSEVVKVGFSWPAFFLGFVWMVVCKLWGKAGLWLGLYLIAVVVEKATDTATDTATDGGLQVVVHLLLAAAYFALWLVPAFQGNAWRVVNLQSRGFELINTLQAETKDAAIARAISPTVVVSQA